MKREVPSLSEKEWPELRKVKASSKTAWRYFEALVKILNRKLGEKKTVEILEELMAENAQKYIQPGMKGFGITGKDAWSLASYFKLSTGDVLGYKTELEEEAPGKVVYRLHAPCIWFPDLKIPASLCHALANFERVAAEIINPSVSVSSRKFMTAGDDCCEIVFEEKKE